MPMDGNGAKLTVVRGMRDQQKPGSNTSGTVLNQPRCWPDPKLWNQRLEQYRRRLHQPEANAGAAKQRKLSRRQGALKVWRAMFQAELSRSACAAV